MSPLEQIAIASPYTLGQLEELAWSVAREAGGLPQCVAVRLVARAVKRATASASGQVRIAGLAAQLLEELRAMPRDVLLEEGSG
jgi:hypothetical protein